MNQIPKRDRYAEDVARIREIVGRHPLPDFVTGFDVRLGEFDGEPAMWVVFKLNGMTGPEKVALANRTRMQLALRHAVTRDLLDTVDDRYPYIHFESEQAADH